MLQMVTFEISLPIENVLELSALKSFTEHFIMMYHKLLQIVLRAYQSFVFLFLLSLKVQISKHNK